VGAALWSGVNEVLNRKGAKAQSKNWPQITQIYTDHELLAARLSAGEAG
jgi:hypothetical protein